jgi:hypothetical protein
MRAHGYTPPSRADCTGSPDRATMAETFNEAQLWEADVSPHTNEKQPTGNEQPTGKERLRK